MVALSPKCYVSWNDDIKKWKWIWIDGHTPKQIENITFENEKIKCKGVNAKQNKQLTKDSFLDILDNGVTCPGKNANLQFKNNRITCDGLNVKIDTSGMGMKQITISKTALSEKLTKSVVRENGSCLPLVQGCNYRT